MTRPLPDSRPSKAAVFFLSVLLVAAACSDPLADAARLQQQGRFDESLEILTPLVAERPNDARLLYLYGHALAQTGMVGDQLVAGFLNTRHPAVS